MSSRHHIDDFMQCRIIGKIEEGQNNRCCQRVRHRSHSVVSRLWKTFKTTECVVDGTGRSCRKYDACRRQIYRPISKKRNRRTTAQQHRTARLQWCREHHNWTEQGLGMRTIPDESRFSLSSDCRRQLIWRESGTVLIVQKISRRKDRYPTCSIMVWGRHHDQWPHTPTCGCEWD
ncbi:hypothetical protein TNCV_1699911 [Trichonephila clavipes]|nr:hypothetical protein TNCV_1699911 [Trichonephila clavipes]